jgi:transposase-like protein
MSDTKLLTKSKPEPVRRLEVFTGSGRRRAWGAEQKARIVAETYGSGETVSAVARRHGLTPRQLFGWRRLARQETRGAKRRRASPCTRTEQTARGRIQGLARAAALAGVGQDADRQGHRPLPFDIWTNHTHLLKLTGPVTISLSIGARATENTELRN